MLVVKLLPPIRRQFEMVTMEKVYHDRLLDLYERKMDMLEDERNAHCNAVKEAREPRISRWKTFNAISLIEATRDLLPHERHQIIAEVWIENRSI